MSSISLKNKNPNFTYFYLFRWEPGFKKLSFITQIFVFLKGTFGKVEDFFLFATILDATMIDKKLGEKPMYFELSIGNAGNTMDGHNETLQEFVESDSDDNLGKICI